MKRVRCVRCGKFVSSDTKKTRVIKLNHNTPFKSFDYGKYGEWWFVDDEKEREAGFLRGIPCGPHNVRHSEHANSTFVIEDYVYLCEKCKDKGGIILDGAVGKCDACGKKKYGMGNNFGHLCEDCAIPDAEYEDPRNVEPCECLRG